MGKPTGKIVLFNAVQYRYRDSSIELFHRSKSCIGMKISLIFIFYNLIMSALKVKQLSHGTFIFS